MTTSYHNLVVFIILVSLVICSVFFLCQLNYSRPVPYEPPKTWRSNPLTQRLTSFQDALDYLKARNRSTRLFQFGANDGIFADPFYKVSEQELWEAVLFEPMPWLFDRLKINRNRPGVVLVNAAVADSTGNKPFHYIPKETINNFNLPEWVQGVSGFGDHIIKTFPRYSKFVKTINVTGLSFDDSLAFIPSHWDEVDILQVDIEGATGEFILNWWNPTRMLPLFINYETLNLGSRRENVSKCLSSHGYRIIHVGKGDTLVGLF